MHSMTHHRSSSRAWYGIVRSGGSRSNRWSRSVSGLALIVGLAACEANQPPAAASQPAPPPPEVAVITVEPTALALTETLPGRLEATQVAEVRARASGIVLERLFDEGSLVEAGQVLFRIDPALLQASLASAQAALAKARANLTQARLNVDRYGPLLKRKAVSQQDYDTAVAVKAAAEADVAAAEAAVQTAQLNLGYTTVKAPISGRIGRALVSVGALVGQGEATPMASIQQLDPIYANLTQSGDDILRLRRAFASGQLERAGEEAASVSLTTADGQAFPHEGALLFTDMTVDPSTGSVSLRAEFPNPEGFLLPGMYVRAGLELAVDQQAITIPQQALQRSSTGALVLLVDATGAVEARAVEVARAHENSWVIAAGLVAGDRVIVEGLQKATAGTAVTPVPWRGGVQKLASGVAE